MAVSIWEGNKAQELIEAVEDAGLSEGVKNALLDIAQNVVYQNQNGATYYNNLYNALYSGHEPEPEPVDPTLVFHLSSPVSIQDVGDRVETEQALGYNTTFTVLFDGVLDASDTTNQRILLYNANTATSNPNLTTGINFVVFKYQNNYMLTGSFQGQDISTNYNPSSSHRVRIAATHDASNHQYKVQMYIDSTKAIDTTKTISLTDTTTKEAQVGAWRTSGATSGGWGTLLGTVNLCSIYNRVLSASEISELLGISA